MIDEFGLFFWGGGGVRDQALRIRLITAVIKDFTVFLLKIVTLHTELLFVYFRTEQHY